MIEAARLKRARRRLRGYFLGGGLIMAFIYLGLAAVIIAMIGADKTSYISTLVMAAGVMAGGAYAIFFFSSVIAHIAKRLWNRQPIMERED